MLIAALDLANFGWSVFPIQPKSKIPFGGTHGHKDASKDASVIGQWAAKYGECNLGLACGTPSGCWVWDVDPRNGGDISLQEAEEKHGKIPDTLIQHTPGGGLHYFFAMPEDGGDIPCASGVLNGCDVKGTGGYVVVAPSIGANGKAYAWEGGEGPDARAPKQAPAWLLSLIRRGGASQQPSEARAPGAQQAPVLRQTIERVPEGSRHEALRTLLGALRHVGQPEEVLRSAAFALNMKFEVPLDKGYIEYQCKWALEHWKPDRPLDTYEVAPDKTWDWHPVGLKEAFATNIPPVQWLIPGVLAKGSVGYIGSPPKLGKSWLSLHVLLCGATGKPFLGMGEFLGGCFKGCYISEEDPERMVYSRLKRLWTGLNPSVSPDGQMKLVVKSGFRLDKPECLAKLEQFILDEHLDLVVMDVFNRLHSKDGNKAEEIIPILAALDGIRTRTGCAILIDTHFKKGLGDDAGSQGQRIAGTVGLHGWSENSIYLDWPKAQGGQAVLNFESKDFAPHDPIVFSISAAEGADEEADDHPLVLSGRPAFDGTKKAAVNRSEVVTAHALAFEKQGFPANGVTAQEVMEYLTSGLSVNTVKKHLRMSGATEHKTREGKSDVSRFVPVQRQRQSASNEPVDAEQVE